jgi:hypothetical protein
VNGTAYSFRLRSENLYGYGNFSTIAIIYTSDVPEMPAPVITSISGLNVLIQWIAPYDNSDAITKYDV